MRFNTVKHIFELSVWKFQFLELRYRLSRCKRRGGCSIRTIFRHMNKVVEIARGEARKKTNSFSTFCEFLKIRPDPTEMPNVMRSVR